MEREILVSTNCQTEGIAEAISVMLPNDRIHILNIPESRTNTDYLKVALDKGISVLITSDELCKTDEFKKELGSSKIFFIPKIAFSAFHPDIVYVKNSKGINVRCLDSDYHSAICFWAWKNNLDAEQTVRLFSEKTYVDLGYMDNWNESLAHLKERIRGTDIDFNRLWSRIKRRLPFMFSFNHPNIFVLSELAKQIAVKLGADEAIYDQPLHNLLTEKLDAIRWPVYPPIAIKYGIEGMYCWKIRGQKYNSLHDYVSSALDNYNTISSEGEELSFNAIGYDIFDQQMQNILKKER